MNSIALLVFIEAHRFCCVKREDQTSLGKKEKEINTILSRRSFVFVHYCEKCSIAFWSKLSLQMVSCYVSVVFVFYIKEDSDRPHPMVLIAIDA
jgi:hypothetical protein